MDIQFELLQDAAALGQSDMLSDLLVAIGQAVIDGNEVRLTHQQQTALSIRLTTFEQYQEWLNEHFTPLLSA